MTRDKLTLLEALDEIDRLRGWLPAISNHRGAPPNFTHTSRQDLKKDVLRLEYEKIALVNEVNDLKECLGAYRERELHPLYVVDPGGRISEIKERSKVDWSRLQEYYALTPEAAERVAHQPMKDVRTLIDFMEKLAGSTSLPVYVCKDCVRGAVGGLLPASSTTGSGLTRRRCASTTGSLVSG